MSIVFRAACAVCLSLTIGGVICLAEDTDELLPQEAVSEYQEDIPDETVARLAELQQIIAQFPDSSEAHYELSQTYLQTGQFEQAFKEICTAVKTIKKNDIAPQTVSVFSKEDQEQYRAAVKLSRKRMEDEAVQRFESLLGTYPNAPDVLYQLSVLYGNAGDYSLFFKYLFMASQYDIESKEQNRILGGLYVILGDNKTAERYFARCLEIDKNYAPAYLWLGKMRFIEKNFEEGIYLLKKSLDIDPEDYATLVTLGRVYMELGYLDAAEDVLKKAVELNPGYWEAYDSLGYLYYYQNEITKSVDMFKEVVVQRPNEVEPLLSLAKVYQMKGFYEDAIKVYKSALKLEPNAFTLHCDLADLYVLVNDLPMAAECFSNALKLYDDSALAHYRLAIIYRKLNKFDQAVAHLKKSILLQSDYRDAYEALYYIYKDDLHNDKEAEYYYRMVTLVTE